MKLFFKCILALFFLINCQVVDKDYNPKRDKERCKLVLIYRVNATKKNWSVQDYPLYLYIFQNEYKECIESTEQMLPTWITSN